MIQIERWLSGQSLSCAFNAALLVGMVVSALLFSKIARKEVMTRVRWPLRFGMMVGLGWLAIIMAWIAVVPEMQSGNPTQGEFMLVATFVIILLAHAIAGCRWARLPPDL